MIQKHTTFVKPDVLNVSSIGLHRVVQFESQLSTHAREISFCSGYSIPSVKSIQLELNRILAEHDYKLNHRFAQAWQQSAVREAYRTESCISKIPGTFSFQLSFGFFRKEERNAFFTVLCRFRGNGTMWMHDFIGKPGGIDFDPRQATRNHPNG